MRYKLFILDNPVQLNTIPPAQASYRQNYKKWSAQTVKNVKPEAKRVREAIHAAVTERSPTAAGYYVHDVRIPETHLNDYVERFTDVWLERAGRHAKLYASGQRSQVASPHAVPPAIQDRLSGEKSLSGNMGGVIGEGLFVGVLRHHFGMRRKDNFAHLAPGNERRFPDFGLLHISERLQQSVGTSSSGQLSYILPAEVKSTAKFEVASDLSSQSESALVQLISFWEQMGPMARGQRPGMIFCALRNPDVQSYDLVIVPIQ